MLNQACSCGCVGENLKLQGQLGSALREGDKLRGQLKGACTVIAAQRLTLKWVVEDAEALPSIAEGLSKSRHGMTLAAIRSGFVSHGTFYQPPEEI